MSPKPAIQGGFPLSFYTSASPEPKQSRRHWGDRPQKSKHYNQVVFVTFLSVKPPAETQSPRNENFLATVLNQKRPGSSTPHPRIARYFRKTHTSCTKAHSADRSLLQVAIAECKFSWLAEFVQLQCLDRKTPDGEPRRSCTPSDVTTHDPQSIPTHSPQESQTMGFLLASQLYFTGK